jgi:hypothetical protein
MDTQVAVPTQQATTAYKLTGAWCGILTDDKWVSCFDELQLVWILLPRETHECMMGSSVLLYLHREYVSAI